MDINVLLHKFKKFVIKVKRFAVKKNFLPVKIFAVVMVFLTVVLTIVISNAFSINKRQKLIEYYENFSISKSDYVIVTDVVKVKNIDYLIFSVSDTNGNEVLDCLDDELVWKLEDFDGIGFRESSLDIVVHTKDVEDIVYLYDGKSGWKLQ